MEYIKKKLIVIFVLLIGILATVSIYNWKTKGVFLGQERKLPIYCVDAKEKKIAISIDVSWGIDRTDDILKVLDKYNIKATFFIVGAWIDQNPDKLKAIYEKGHEIGNHSTTHPNMSTLSSEQIVNELATTDEKITNITKVKPTLFRPPFGDYDDLLIQTARQLDYYTIQWDIDSLDWKELGVEPVIDKVVKGASEGSIILFHNNAKYIKEYLPVIIQRLQEKGYEIVPVSELIYKDNFRIDNSGRQIKLQ